MNFYSTPVDFETHHYAGQNDHEDEHVGHEHPYGCVTLNEPLRQCDTKLHGTGSVRVAILFPILTRLSIRQSAEQSKPLPLMSCEWSHSGRCDTERLTRKCDIMLGYTIVMQAIITSKGEA